MSASSANYREKKGSRARRRPVVRQRPECRGARKPQVKTLLWIDDYLPGLKLYKYMFESRGYRVLTASRPTLGLRLAASNAVDAVVVDYEMPEMNGEKVAAILKKVQPNLPVILFTGSGQIPDRVRKVIDAYCDKAGPGAALEAAIQRVLAVKPVSRSATPVYAA